MYYYKIKDKILLSEYTYKDLKEISEEEAGKAEGLIYALCRLSPGKSRKSFSVSDPSLLYLREEGLNLILKTKFDVHGLPEWLLCKIKSRQVMAINTEYSGWQEKLKDSFPRKWKINISGLGDVGSTLLVGLRLLGGDTISSIGIYDRNPNKIKRWDYETNQILSPSDSCTFPKIHGISEDELFNCDMFVFCISAGVPPIGQEEKDVRLVQFQENSRIIGDYAKKARRSGYKGIFAVVSDPVDLLCKSVFLSSNTNDSGNIDFKGLAPEQIRGYGLGVMHARAAYYAMQSSNTGHYLNSGRAFGPHGNGLVIADSIENYNEDISLYLTEKAVKANIDVRNTGFKPYIAPALSSGSLSIISTINGSWHYSSVFMGGIYMGVRNRLTPSGFEIERYCLPDNLFNRIQKSYEGLGNML